MKCPVCQTELKIAERQGVEIDYCPQCRGVWLDRGELDKIIERSSEFTAQQPASPAYEERPRGFERDDNDDYDRGYPRKRKSGSFLSDIFDF